MIIDIYKELNMHIKQFAEITNPEIWDLSEKDDIIIAKEGSKDQRVLINFNTYESLKNTLFRLQQQISDLDDESYDWSPHVNDFNDILKNSNFKEVKPNHFEKLAKK
jgi:hypothetical protein